jgi:hypothetical protein
VYDVDDDDAAVDRLPDPESSLDADCADVPNGRWLRAAEVDSLQVPPWDSTRTCKKWHFIQRCAYACIYGENDQAQIAAWAQSLCLPFKKLS